VNFGTDEHPKWSEKEEMTLIFLAAFNEYGPGEIRGEINALFGHDRSLEAVTARLEKDQRAVAALKDLGASNPIAIAKFWKRAGVVNADVKDEHDPLIICDADTIREVVQGKAERSPSGPTLYDKLRKLFPEFDGYDTSEETLLNQIRQLIVKSKTPPTPVEPETMAVSLVTEDQVEFEDGSEVTMKQLEGVLRALRSS